MSRPPSTARLRRSAGPAVLVVLAVAHGLVGPALHRWWVAAVVAVGVLSIAAGVRINRAWDDRGWRRFAIGVAWYGSSDVAWLLVTGALGPDHPAATATWLLGLPGIAVAVLGLRRVLASGDVETDRETALDGVLVALSVGYVGWNALVLPLVRAEGWGYYGVIGSTPYWVLAVLALGLVLSRGLRGGGSPSLALLAAAVPVTAMSSVVYWTVEAEVAWESAPAARALMASAYALAAAATAHPSMRGLTGETGTAASPSGWPRLLLVGIGIATVPAWHALEVVVDLPHPDPVASVLSVLITGLGLARIGMTLYARHSVETELRLSEARFRSVVERSRDYILIVDGDSRIMWGSANTGGITGRNLDDVRGEPLFENVVEEDLADAWRLFHGCTGTPSGSAEGSVRVRAGEAIRTVAFSFANQLDDPAVAGVVVNYRDVTETVRAQEELVHQATHDALTGLPNRVHLTARMDELAADPAHRMAVLFLDLDHFKLVNDGLGHHVGDQLLAVVAERLSDLTVEDDHVVARIGGDEFVVLVEQAGADADVLALAGRVCDALAAPVHVDAHELAGVGSIGIAIRTAGETPEELLRDADAAMYRAKAQGRDGFVLFQPDFRGASGSRLRVEVALRRALQDGRGLQLHYQPVVSLVSGRIEGVEALLRWHDGVLPCDEATGRPMSPADVVAVAEETGLIGPLGDWVVSRALADLAELDRLSPASRLEMAVNVSGAQLRRGDFAMTVARNLAETGIAASRLVVELTESVLVDDVPAARTTLARLQETGVRLAMDDFGTGYSALQNLKRIPFGVVKIDRSFVGGMGTDGEDTAIVHAVVGMAHALGLKVVAEGVEEAQQHRALHDVGCDFVQGWHFGRPMPLDRLLDLLANGDPRPGSLRVA